MLSVSLLVISSSHRWWPTLLLDDAFFKVLLFETVYNQTLHSQGQYRKSAELEYKGGEKKTRSKYLP